VRRLADELDADAVQEQVELLEVEGAVAVVVDVLDEVVDLRCGLSRHENTTTARDRSEKGVLRKWMALRLVSHKVRQ
tara:strand:- start:158 stop:388 length:231 start_codon:yes stop_codon:yes gene_type:complete